MTNYEIAEAAAEKFENLAADLAIWKEMENDQALANLNKLGSATVHSNWLDGLAESLKDGTYNPNERLLSNDQ